MSSLNGKLIVDGKQYDVESMCRIYDAAMAADGAIKDLLGHIEAGTLSVQTLRATGALMRAIDRAKETERS